MKKRNLGMLRNRISIIIKKDIQKLEHDLSIQLTTAAKKNIRSSTVRVFRAGSPDLKKSGDVRIIRQHAYKGRGKSIRRVMLVEKINVVEVTKGSIGEVVVEAKRIAQKSGFKNKVTASHVDQAIQNSWCKVYPVCNRITGRRLGLKVLEKNKNDE